MELFFWKKNRLVDQFAKTLADELFSYLQPAVAESYFAAAAGKLPPAQVKDLERRLKELGFSEPVAREINKVILLMRWVNYAPYIGELAKGINEYLDDNDRDIFARHGIKLPQPGKFMGIFG